VGGAIVVALLWTLVAAVASVFSAEGPVVAVVAAPDSDYEVVVRSPQTD
jgi:hypothetical protein